MRSNSINTKEDIQTVALCWAHLKNTRIASKQLYDTAAPRKATPKNMNDWYEAEEESDSIRIQNIFLYKRK